MMNEKGSAVVLVTFAMIIVFFLGTALVHSSQVEFRTSQNYADEVKAYYIAEAGMEKALALLRIDHSLLKDMTDMSEGNSTTLPVGEAFGEGSFSDVSVQVTDKNNTFCTIELACKGFLNRAEREVLVQARVFYETILTFDEGINIGTVAKNGKITGSENIVADFTFRGEVEIKTCTVEGNVKGYKVKVDNSALVKGNVEYVDSISCVRDKNGNPINITGTVTQIDEIDIPPLPEISSKQYLAAAKDLEEVPGTRVFLDGYKGDFDLSKKEPGIYYIDGSLTVRGKYTGNITVVATGNITTGDIEVDSDKAENHSENALILVSYSNISMGNSKVEGLLYVTSENGTKGSLSMSGNGTLIGAAIADVLDINGHVQLQFDDGLAAQAVPGVPAGIEVTYWRESSDIL